MKMIALVDYGSGNIHSAERALRDACVLAGQPGSVCVTSDPGEIAAADRIVLPGVGHYADCMAGVAERDGLLGALEDAVLRRAVPFLGICVGMQLMADIGREDGETRGFGWIAGVVEEITPGPGYRIPHMGWNTLDMTADHPVLAGLGDDPHAYFVHSYAFATSDPAHTVATTDYGVPFAAAVARDNLFGTQFHPEKSQAVGLKLLSNFIAWTP